MKKPFICGKWHAWSGSAGQIMLSDEDKKDLYTFSDINVCITWLYVSGFKDVAKALNNHVNLEKP